jgi:hypothetical protein
VTVLNALFRFAEGKEKQRQAMEASEHELFLGESERIQGLRDQNELTEQLFSTLSAQKLTIAANGVDLSSPGAQKIAAETIKRGEREISKVKTDTIIRREARRARSRSLLRKGRFDRIAGFVAGIDEIGSTISRGTARG